MTFNPSAPDTIGQEWRPYLEGVLALDASAKGVGLYLPSSATETADQIILPHQWPSSPSSGYGRLWADVYNVGSSPVAGAVTELTFSPNEDKARSNTTRSDFSTTTNLYQTIDDVDDSGPPEASDYIVNANYGGTGTYRMQFNTASIPSSWRILYVRLEIRAKGFDWSWQSPRIDVEWWNGSSKLGKIGSISPPQDYVFRTYNLGPWYFDFFNEGCWLQPEIANLDVNTSRNLGLTFNYSCAVSRVTLKVGVIAENRVAVGISSKVTVPPTGVQTNNPILLKTPLNVDNLAKTSGVNYVAVVRRLEDPFGTLSTLSPQIVYLDSGAANPHDRGETYDVTVDDASGKLSAAALSTSTRCLGAVIGTSGGASSVDSQPYWDVEAKSVSWSYVASQAVAGASAQSYRRWRAMVARISGTTPEAPLAIGVRRTTVSTGLGDASETWTGSNGASWPAQWTSGSGTTGAAATIQTNAGQMTTGTTASGYYRHLLNVALNAQVLVQTQVTFASVAAANSARIFLGGTTFTGGVLNSGYEIRLTANSNTVALYRTDAAGAQTLITSTSFTFAAATAYQVKVYRLATGVIQVKVWTGTEPDLVTLGVSDTTHTISRLALGVLGGGDTSSDTITFDTLSVWQYLAVGDLSAADLADSAIATSKGTIALGPGTMDVYDVTVTLDTAATLAGSTDYTLDVGATVNYSTGWFLLWADSTSTHALTGNQTYGGSTDAAAPGAGVTTAGADFLMTLGSVPTTPTSISAAVTTIDLPNNGGADALCDPGTAEVITVTWVSGAALGASFAAWRVERSADNKVTWEPFVVVTTEATLSWQDQETARGVAHHYRVRAERTDGAFSDWRETTTSVTPAASPGVLLFVSNADPTIATGFILASPSYDYEFLSAGETTFMRFHLRDFQVAFKPLEDRGVRWAFPVLVYGGEEIDAPPGGRGIRAFDGLRAVGQAAVPYVCLLTPDGERLFVSVQVPKGHREEPGQVYVGEVIVTQVAGESLGVEV